MTDRPILFSGPMVRAILDERKSQTRRVINPRRHASLFDGSWTDSYVLDPGNEDWRRSEIPYRAGDRLYVREHWRSEAAYDDLSPSAMGGEEPISYEADGAHQTWGYPAISKLGRFRQGMHMPRWASRLTLIVTDVRVQRLQEISETDAVAEGLAPLVTGRFFCGRDEDGEITCKSPVTAFGWLWNSINGERPGCHWQDNPWVVAISFRPIQQNIDQIAEVPS